MSKPALTWNLHLPDMSVDRKKGAGLKKRKICSVLIAGILSVGMILTGCGAGQPGGQSQKKETEAEKKLKVVTTIFPQYDFVRQIAGDQVELQMLLKPGEETHSYEPTPQDIIAIQNCDLFIYVGGENDAWVEDILESMPDNGRKTLKLTDCVDTVEEEQKEGMKEERDHDHEDGQDQDSHDEESHSVHEIDEHVWTSPVNAEKIVEVLADQLEELDQKNAAVYKENAAEYEEKLQELDGQFREVVENADSRLLIFGDRFPFRYLAEEYGLDYYAAFSGCASDTEPSAATMAFLINKVKEEKVPTVLKMELSNDNIAKAIAEATGTDVKVFYSCHNLTAQEFKDGETYLSMMEKNVETLKEVLNGWH